MQHLVLVSLALLVIGLTYTALKLPGRLSQTFSQRVANNTIAEILYSVLFLCALPLLYLFFADWFVPTNHISQMFLIFAAVAVVFQIGCTWVPERGGRMTVIHRTLTGISGIALLPAVLVITTARSISVGLRYAIWGVLALMIILLIVALANQKGFRYALLLQVGYYALFFATILVVTYR